MKKLLFLLLFSIFTFGQNIQYKKIDSVQFESSKNQILSSLNKPFKEIDKGEFNDKFYYKYQNDNEIFYIFYVIRNEGENKDLEKKGVRLWTIETIIGKYLTIFDFYKKNYNSKANLEEIQKIGQDFNSPQDKAQIRRNSMEGFWEIRFW